MVDLLYVRRIRRKRIAAFLSLGATAGLVTFGIISFLGRSVGTFSIVLQKSNVAVSLCEQSNFEKPSSYLNVPNLPENEIKGIKTTKMGFIEYRGGYEKRVDPYGKPYYWVNGKPVVIDKNPDCDNNAVADGYVSITPLNRDYTAYSLMDSLKEMCKNI